MPESNPSSTREGYGNIRRMANTPSMASPGRAELYTNAHRVFLDADDYFYLHINLDTWYYSAWGQPNGFGTLPLGVGPLTALRGAGSFVEKQVSVIQHSFAGVLHLNVVQVWYRPQLNGVYQTAFHFAAPDNSQDLRAICRALEQASYGGITRISLPFSLWATIRSEQGELQGMWLPDAGEVSFQARNIGSYSSRSDSTEVKYDLSPLAKAGRALWTVEIQCNLVSLFCRSNAEVLKRVRTGWLEWVEMHPDGRDFNMEENDQTSGGMDRRDTGVVTLVDPPAGAPSDNLVLHELNAPHLRSAILRWAEAMGCSFEWSIDLDA